MTEDEHIEQSRMTLGDHLEELRSRLIKSVLAILIVFVGAWVFHKPIAEVVLQPMKRTVGMLNAELDAHFAEQLKQDPDLDREQYFENLGLRYPIPSTPRADAASSGFFLYMKTCLIFSAFVGGPFILWQIWKFIAAGLYKNERRTALRYFPFSMLLFLGGVLFGYFMLVPYGQFYLARMSILQVEYYPEVGLYFTFLTSLSLALGLVFQLPILMLALVRLGLVEARAYGSFRGHFWIISLIVAAVLTPPDPITQLMMALPMVLLYELGNFLGRMAARSAERALAETGAAESS